MRGGGDAGLVWASRSAVGVYLPLVGCTDLPSALSLSIHAHLTSIELMTSVCLGYAICVPALLGRRGSQRS